MIPELRPLEGKYEILRKLREGGMGAIYLVRHRLLEELRVIKVMRPQLQDEGEFRTRFLREAKVAIQLRHPNIAQLYDFAIDDDGAGGYMVLEFVDGRNLQDLIAERGIRSLSLKIRIACQALEALGFLHRRGFVHRDVSPDNLMITLDHDGAPLVKLIDLGIVKVLHGEGGGHTGTQVFLGKIRYASPEQFESSRIDQRSDLYSLGILLYEWLTGVYPVRGENIHSLISGHMFKPPIPFEESDPGGAVPGALRQIVLRALVKDPEQRFQTAEEFEAALEALDLPIEPDEWASETGRLGQILGVGPESGGPAVESAQERLDQKFVVGDTTPQPKPISESQRVSRGSEALARKQLDDAAALLDEGRFEAAAQALESAARYQLVDAELLRRRDQLERRIADERYEDKLGRCAAELDAGRIDEGEALLRELLKTRPEDARGRRLEARALAVREEAHARALRVQAEADAARVDELIAAGRVTDAEAALARLEGRGIANDLVAARRDALAEGRVRAAAADLVVKARELAGRARLSEAAEALARARELSPELTDVARFTDELSSLQRRAEEQARAEAERQAERRRVEEAKERRREEEAQAKADELRRREAEKQHKLEAERARKLEAEEARRRVAAEREAAEAEKQRRRAEEKERLRRETAERRAQEAARRAQESDRRAAETVEAPALPPVPRPGPGAEAAVDRPTRAPNRRALALAAGVVLLLVSGLYLLVLRPPRIDSRVSEAGAEGVPSAPIAPVEPGRPLTQPAEPAVPPARLEIDAAPWGEVVAIAAENGTAVESSLPASTPLRVRLAPGAYRVSVRDPRTGATKSERVTLDEDGASLRIRLAPVAAEDYFRSLGIEP